MKLESLLHDLRYAFRRLASTPGFTATAILTLIVALGVNTIVFSLVNAVFFPVRPYAEPDRLVRVWWSSRLEPQATSPLSYLEFLDVSAETGLFESVCGRALTFQQPMALGGNTVAAEAALVSGDCFETYGFSPIRGRLLGREDVTKPGADPVCVISARIWKQHLASRDDVIGTQVRFNNHQLTIVGVAPDGPDIWAPITMVRELAQMSERFGSRSSAATLSRFFTDRTLRRTSVTARLRPGVSVEDAAARADSFRATFAEADPTRTDEFDIRVTPAFRWQPNWTYKQAARLMGVSGLVLFIACANLVGLLLARGTTRAKEIAVRLTMGAGRGRIIRQLMLENLMIAAAAGVGGLLATVILSRALTRLAPPADSEWNSLTNAQLDWRVLMFAIGLVVVTTLAFGLWPALRTSRANAVGRALTGGDGMLSGCRTRLFSAGNLLLISQFAVSTVMVLVAGAFVAHFFRISATDTGISRTSVGTVELMLGVTRPDAAEIRQLLEDLRRRAGESQGLHGLTFATNLPSGIRGGIAITPEGRPTFSQTGGSATIGAGLFETLGIPLIQGRDFHDLDRPGAPQVAIVSASAAATWFPGQAPLGRRFNVNGMQGWFEIVGVVGNTQVDLVRGGEKMFYLPLSQNPRWDLMVLASAPGGSVAATQAIRRLILDVDSNLAVGPAKSVGQLLEESIFTQWLFASGFGSLAALALFLAALGLHGSMAYLVSRQTRELGLRIALGATAVDLQRMVVWQGMRVVAIGTAVGLYAAVLAIESIQKMTVEPVTSIGLGAFALGPTVLAVAALSACYLPARRASQVDPVVALRAL